jgi:hypothetical protein
MVAHSAAVFILLCWPLAAAAGPVEFSGVGNVRIIGGNQVSARQRALREAHQQAVSQALSTILDEGQLRRLAPQLRRIVAGHRAYVRNYRVIAESEEGASFRVEVAVVLDLKRLRQDLRQVVGPGSAGSPAARVRLAWWPRRELSEATVVADLEGELRGAGFEPVRVADEATARRAGAPAMLSLGLEVKDSPGVRGLALAGAHAVAQLRARLTTDGTLLAEKQGEGWGVGETAAEARRAAARRALRQGLGPLLRLFEARWPGRLDGGKRKLVQITGLTSPLQHEAVHRALERQIAGVRRCRPWRLASGSAWFSLETTLDEGQLAEALQRQPFDFRLRPKSIGAGVAWLELEPLPPTSGPSGAPLPAGEEGEDEQTF